jgi:hypothetical protein
MICVVVLENCVDLVEGETVSCSEACVRCDGDGSEAVCIECEESIDIKEEISFKIEEAIDIKDEIPEAKSFPSVKNEHEVRLWGVGEGVAACAFVVCVRWWQLVLLVCV